MSTSLILLGIVILLVLFVIGIYNNLIRLQNYVKNGWRQIDLAKDVIFHRSFYLFFTASIGKLEFRIQRISFKRL